MALYLYFQLTFGQLDQRNPEVIKLAVFIGRTPSSVAMKLGNIASIDPKILASGRKGLTGASAQDRRIWESFHLDWTGLVTEIEEFLSKPEILLPAAQVKEDVIPFNFEQFSGQTIKQTVIDARVGQQFFRRAVLANFEERCCVTGIAEPRLLIASHIVPWSVDVKNRHNPANGLCLSATFDRAFDTGLMTINRDMRVTFSPKLLEHENDQTRQYFEHYEGRDIEPSLRFLPDPELLEWHNVSVYAGL